MIHSIISCEDIFYREPVRSEYKLIDGGLIEIEDYCGRKRVKRLITTNQRMYLDARFSPYSDFTT